MPAQSELPKARIADARARAIDDPLRLAKVIGIAVAVVAGWAFILIANKLHVTAPVVFVCLGYFAVVMTVVNFWRTGAAAAAPDDPNDEWGRPLGDQDELEKEKRTLLKAIKEAEFDLAMNKLSKRDADSLIQQYRARAIDVIKELDRLGDSADLPTSEKIRREVKARIELAASDKPSNRAKNAAAKRKAARPGPKADANAADAKSDAKTEAKIDAKADDAKPAEAVVEAKADDAKPAEAVAEAKADEPVVPADEPVAPLAPPAPAAEADVAKPAGDAS